MAKGKARKEKWITHSSVVSQGYCRNDSRTRMGAYANVADCIFDEGSHCGKAAIQFYRVMHDVHELLETKLFFSSPGAEQITRDEKQILLLRAAWSVGRALSPVSSSMN
jgi:hypothetical protein